MGLFSRKDWNVVAIVFERHDCYRVNAHRGKGGRATKIRDGARKHSRTIFWAVFDQSGKFLEGDNGRGSHLIDAPALQKLKREIVTNQTVRHVLSMLENGENEKAAKTLQWSGYPQTQ